MTKYQPSQIEPKWQKYWQEQGTYDFKLDTSKEAFYNLVELPYPSGDLHVGHWFTFTTADVVARFKRMSGYNVFFTNGYDAFGLPAENAAIKRNIHPKDWTTANIASMTKQFQTLGTMIDWRFSLATCEPSFYKWNQWLFLRLFEKGLAYQGKALANWCPSCQTVLANENVEAGKCWRCGSEVIQKEIKQWFFKITDYADKLIWPESPSVDWPLSVRVGQNNWIGRSEGLLIDFPLIPDTKYDIPHTIQVFTTRPETADGASFLVIAPEHPFVQELLGRGPAETGPVQDIKAYVEEAKRKSEMERKENKTKTGVFSGQYVTNPVTKQQIPVWISDYVLAGYGTGAIMAVPAEDERDGEFAQQFNLPIPKTTLKAEPEGQIKVQYHIHDWSISRQRYWGTPVPIIHCPKDGLVPVPEKDLPIELPYEVDFAPKGKAPLASATDWIKVKCPVCGGEAERDAETLDTFVDSSWYYYRYLSPAYDLGPFDPELARKIMPVSIYFGGAEHTLGHTLYARFITKFFNDLGLIDFDEFALKRIQHGTVLGPDGNKMSKSKGNVINPDDVVREYGSDTVRLYLCFMMPYEATGPWSNTAIAGTNRFLTRVWDLQNKLSEDKASGPAESILHKTVHKITTDLAQIKTNTSIAALMEWLNFLSKQPSVSHEEYSVFLKLLAPFAPHLADELWQTYFGKSSVHLESWPEVNPVHLISERLVIPVSINGKVRDQLEVERGLIEDKEALTNMALALPKVSRLIKAQNLSQVISVPGKILNLVTK